MAHNTSFFTATDARSPPTYPFSPTASSPSSTTSSIMSVQPLTTSTRISSEPIKPKHSARRRSAPPDEVGSLRKSPPFSTVSFSASCEAISTPAVHIAGHVDNSNSNEIVSPSSPHSPSPPLSPIRLVHLARQGKWSPRHLCLLLASLICLLVVGNVYIGGIVTLEDLHGTIRYLLGGNGSNRGVGNTYHRQQQQPHLANLLVYLIGSLLLVSFWTLALFTHPTIQLVGLPFHLLIGTALTKLVPEYTARCAASYVMLGIVFPHGSRLLARGQYMVRALKDYRFRSNSRAKGKQVVSGITSIEAEEFLLPPLSRALQSSSSSSAVEGDVDEEKTSLIIPEATGEEAREQLQQQRRKAGSSWISFHYIRQTTWASATQLYTHLESALIFLSGGNPRSSMYTALPSSAHKTSTSLPPKEGAAATARATTAARWYRLAIASFLWMWFVWSLWRNNEPREFDPSHAARPFRISDPKPICSGWELEGYQSRHASLDDYWLDYRTLHQQIMSLAESVNGRSAVPSGSISPLLDKFKQPQLRFLIFRPGEHDNPGQRLQGLISAVVMAMITQRAIIVDWSPLGSFEVPLDSLFQAPEGIDWFFNSTAFMAIRSSDLYRDRAYSWLPYCRDCLLRSPLSASSPWSQLLCSPSLGLDNHHPVIEISSAQWFFPVLQHNVFWRGEMCAMFPGGGRDAFAQLAARLLRPSTQVQALVDGVLAQVPRDATFVGMQIEANPTTTPSALSSFAALVRDSKLQDTHIIEDAFLNCAKQAIADEEEERMSVKEMEHNTSPDINKGFSGNHSEQFSQREERQPIRYFLSTDSLKTREYLQHALHDRILVLNGTYDSLRLHTSEHSTTWRDILFGPRQLPDSSSHHTERQNSISYDPTLSPSTSASSPPYSLPSTLDAIRATQAMVAEIWILAQTKRLIVTPSSSQGSVAHGLANLSPDLVTSDFECRRRQHSTQPCFQYWFAYALRGAACSIRATEEMSGDYNCWP